MKIRSTLRAAWLRVCSGMAAVAPGMRSTDADGAPMVVAGSPSTSSMSCPLSSRATSASFPSIVDSPKHAMITPVLPPCKGDAEEGVETEREVDEEEMLVDKPKTSPSLPSSPPLSSPLQKPSPQEEADEEEEEAKKEEGRVNTVQRNPIEVHDDHAAVASPPQFPAMNTTDENSNKKGVLASERKENRRKDKEAKRNSTKKKKGGRGRQKKKVLRCPSEVSLRAVGRSDFPYSPTVTSPLEAKQVYFLEPLKDIPEKERGDDKPEKEVLRCVVPFLKKWRERKEKKKNTKTKKKAEDEGEEESLYDFEIAKAYLRTRDIIEEGQPKQMVRLTLTCTVRDKTLLPLLPCSPCSMCMLIRWKQHADPGRWPRTVDSDREFETLYKVDRDRAQEDIMYFPWIEEEAPSGGAILLPPFLGSGRFFRLCLWPEVKEEHKEEEEDDDEFERMERDYERDLFGEDFDEEKARGTLAIAEEVIEEMALPGREAAGYPLRISSERSVKWLVAEEGRVFVESSSDDGASGKKDEEEPEKEKHLVNPNDDRCGSRRDCSMHGVEDEEDLRVNKEKEDEEEEEEERRDDDEDDDDDETATTAAASAIPSENDEEEEEEEPRGLS